jgi:hypothetical protein
MAHGYRVENYFTAYLYNFSFKLLLSKLVFKNTLTSIHNTIRYYMYVLAYNCPVFNLRLLLQLEMEF